MTGPGSLAGPAGNRSPRTRFIRIGVLALALGVSLGIVILRLRPIVPVAQLVLFAVSVLVGVEVILVGTYHVVTRRLVPTTRWTSFLLGVHPPATPPPARQVRLLGGLLVIVGGLLVLGGLLAFFTATNVWSSPP
jgi:hypothetical protein